MSQDDHRSPEAMVGAMYDVISGPADEERDWDRFRALFQPGARIQAFTRLPDGTPQAGVWSLDEYQKAAASFYAEEGFWEREIGARTERFGSIAHVFSAYESTVGSREGDPVGRGVNSIQMVRHDDRWWITSVAFDLEREGRSLPSDLVGA